MATKEQINYTIPKTTIFQRALEQGIRLGLLPGRTKAARNWYRNYAGNLVDPRRNRLIARGHGVASGHPGNMYMFYYDPKHKDTLPFYDRFPVIFIIDYRENGFLGLNLHYLPMGYRAALMDALMSLKTNNRFDDKTKLHISYNILKATTKYAMFQPCIKRYLTSHIQSPLVEVPASDWDIAAFLPVAQWTKSSRQNVYNDSISRLKR